MILKKLITVTALLGLSTGVLGQQKPNIVIIFTDDQGYADLGCFGSNKNQTPALDQLA